MPELHFLVCIAGLPQSVVEEIQARPAARFTEDRSNVPIVRPVRAPFGFRTGMSDGFLEELASRVSNINPSDDVAVILAFVGYGGKETARFVGDFFPFSLVGRLEPFYPDARPKLERRSALVSYVNEVEGRIADLRNVARTVRDSLSGRNFTPLLLPLRNFRSKVLRPKIQELYISLAAAPDPRAILALAEATILALHPIKDQQRGKERDVWFEDDRDLRFMSPGRNRHGMARLVGEGHKPHCLISGRVRLGGPFDSRFHYDCDYERKQLDPLYPNCHAEETKPNAVEYVNIAPSDYIR